MNLFYVDFEATGPDSDIDIPWQIGYIMEVDGKVIQERNMYIDVSHLTEKNWVKEAYDMFLQSTEGKDIEWKTLEEVIATILIDINTYRKKSGDTSKWTIVGYNAKFDSQLMYRTFLQFTDEGFYFKHYFEGIPLDIMQIVLWYVMPIRNKILKFSLKNICTIFGIELKAHDALNDIRATRELHKLVERHSEFKQFKVND